MKKTLSALLVVLAAAPLLLQAQAARTEEKKLEGFVEENLTVPVANFANAVVRIDNKRVLIDGYWEFKDEAGEILEKPKILSQPPDLEDRIIFALRAPGTAKVSVTEGDKTTVYTVNVRSRFRENDIEKELEEAILTFVKDPGLKVTVLPPQASLVGANIRRAFGDETSSEILAPRGDTASASTGQITQASDYRPVIVLEGEVANDLKAMKALNIAHAYTDSVINLMSIKEQVQVQIKVNVLSVSLTKESNIGMQYGTRSPGGVFTPGFTLPLNVREAFNSGAPFFRVFNQNVVGDFQAQLNAAASRNEIKILQSPTLTVLNGQPAEFFVGSVIFAQTSVSISDGIPVVEFAERQVGVTLRIAPITREETTFRERVDGTIPFSTISTQDRKTTRSETTQEMDPSVREQVVNSVDENGVVRLLIQPSVSLPGDVDTFGNRDIITSQVETRVAMRHGETMIIGGLFDSQNDKLQENIPFLEKIPILGELFKNRNKTDTRNELVFTLTPYITGLGDLDGHNERAITSPKMAAEMQAANILPKPVRISGRDVFVRDPLSVPEATPAPVNIGVRPGEMPAEAPAEAAPAPAGGATPALAPAP